MTLGRLTFALVQDNYKLVAPSVKALVERANLADVNVAAIDPTLADTAAFCEHYDIGLEISANCVIVEAKRADKIWYAACVILATTRADINGVVRRQLDARKITFAPMDRAVTLTGMEYGGITPIGLPSDWPVIIDQAVAAIPQAIIGSGIRGSKLLVSGQTLATLPNAIVLDIVKPPLGV